MADRVLFDHLAFIYGKEAAEPLVSKLEELLARFRQRNPEMGSSVPDDRVTHRDSVFITYGDMVQRAGESPLVTLTEFLSEQLSGVVSTVHILPFYPYSSDDGFSVVDYEAVDEALGTWEDVAQLGRKFRLLFDAVINHISARSEWFRLYLNDHPKYREYFITVDPRTDLSEVFRPRALPLLTEVVAVSGKRHVWTTFSADQIDLNYANPEVLLDIMRTQLFYVEKGAELIRLDAIGFMWKEVGTSCLHLPKTHRIIQLMRAVLDRVAPHVVIITETNVPHEENISYFGDGYNEAQLVYNFTLPPLTLHAFHTGSAEILSRWAASLELPSRQVTFFNFLASHDGIGLMPVRGILSDTAVATMADRVTALGGHVSYKDNPDGTRSPYELNISYLDALRDPEEDEVALETEVRRFLVSQAIMLALRGVPGIYFHSLFGSRSWHEGVQQTGRNRTINRQKLEYDRLARELADRNSLRGRVFRGYRDLLNKRYGRAAFHPNGEQRIIFCHESVFALLRTSPTGTSSMLCLHNVSNRQHTFSIEMDVVLKAAPNGLFNIVDGTVVPVDQGSSLTVTLPPYEIAWLASEQLDR